MTVTEIRITPQDHPRLRAFVSLVFDDVFAVRGIKIIAGKTGHLFLAMPSRRKADGTYQDILHPITPEFRNDLEAIVLTEYTQVLRAGIPAGGNEP